MNNPEAPVVLLDVDGVLADFLGGSLEALEAAGCPLAADQAIRTWSLRDGLTKLQHATLGKAWRAPGFAASLQAYPDAAHFVHELRALGRVLFVTTPMISSATWYQERQAWLVRKVCARPEDVVFVHDKALVRGDVFIDDRYENASAWGVANPTARAVLFARSYNADAVLTNALPGNVAYLGDYDAILKHLKKGTHS